MKYKIISIICMAAGLALLSVPLFFSLYGGMRNRELMEEVEKFGLEDMNAEKKYRRIKGRRGKPILMRRKKPYIRRGMSLVSLRLKP